MSKKLELLQGTLDLIVLGLLRSGPANGWDLTNAIQATSRGVLDVNYGSIYPALRRLEARGLVKGKWGTSDNNRRAKYYELTRKGRAQLDSQTDAWRKLTVVMQQVLDKA